MISQILKFVNCFLDIKNTKNEIQYFDDIIKYTINSEIPKAILLIMINYNHFCMNNLNVDINDVEYTRKVYEKHMQ